MSRLTIAILFGGCSEEHDVSVKSATEIAASIDPQKYEPIYVGITQSGAWKRRRGRPTSHCAHRRGVSGPARQDG